MRTRVWGLGLAAAALVAGHQSAPAAAAAPAAATAPAEVRVNQVGYGVQASKVAFVMLAHRVARVSFTVSGRNGQVLQSRGRKSRNGLTAGSAARGECPA
jgi:hypothetical protein